MATHVGGRAAVAAGEGAGGEDVGAGEGPTVGLCLGS